MKLGEIPEIVHDSLEPPHLLHSAAIRLAISHIDQPEIAEVLCDYWFKCLSRHVRPLSDASEARSDQDGGIWGEAHRRAFVRALIFHPEFEKHSERRFFWGSENLVTLDDFDWSLNELFLAQSGEQWRWALVVAHSLWSVDLRGERGERLQQAWELCPSIRIFLPDPLPGETLPHAMQRVSERRQAERDRERAVREKRRRRRDAKFQADLAAHTEACRSAHEEGKLIWPGVMRILSARANGPGEALITFDLISGIGASELWMVKSAERYLRELPTKRAVELADGLTGLLALAACMPRVEADQEFRRSSSRDEEHIAVESREWLQDDLEVVSEREVKLSSSHRTDLLVQVATPDRDQWTVVVELKKVRKNNARERRTAMQTQLRDTYLRERLAEGWTHGLYVVAWTPEPGTKLDSKGAMDEECGRLGKQAAKLSEAPYVLRSLVIDARSSGNGG